MIDADCGETPVDNPFVQTILENMKYSGLPQIVEGVCAHTDIGWFQTMGIPAIVIGPGNPRLAHQNDERVKEEDLIKLTKFIANVLVSWVEVQ
jgi:acetylornithine deacetylase